MSLSITAASFIPSASATPKSGVAGAAITQGQALYIDTADDSLKLCDANGTFPAYVFEGLARNRAEVGQLLDYITEDPLLQIGATLAVGQIVCTSATPGALEIVSTSGTTIPIAGYFPVIVGIGGPTVNTLVMRPVAAGGVMI